MHRITATLPLCYYILLRAFTADTVNLKEIIINSDARVEIFRVTMTAWPGQRRRPALYRQLALSAWSIES
jgi:hypothetical protein